MANDRNEKFDGHEESEYHFSDEDVSYEVETEAPKAAAPTSDSKMNALKNLPRSKRMLISLGVFFLLIFIVYKMVSPSTSMPNAQIAPVVTATTTAQQNMSRNPMSNMRAGQPTQAANAPVAPNQNQAMQQPPVNQVMMAQQQNQTPAAQPANPAPAMNNMPMPQQPMAAQQQMPQQQMPPQQQMAPPQATGMPQQQPGMPPPQNMQAEAGMPPVMPVRSNAPVYAPNQPPSMVNMPEQANNVAPLAAMEANNEKLVNQLQSDYTQKMNDYAAQNKALLDQVQSLNTKVSSLESQMSQMVQALTRQDQQAAPPSPAAEQSPPRTSETRESSYSVQAIIPGRAWLRSANGESVTVAEGDVVKDLGRVIKIDPYDGVVEINTGTKVISLTYGNGG